MPVSTDRTRIGSKRAESNIYWSDILNNTEKIKPPTKQHTVDWIAAVKKKLHLNLTIVKKLFLVTGISNAQFSQGKVMG